MSGQDPDFLVVGHMKKAHGIKGELYVVPLTDHPDSTFASGVELRVGDGTGRRPTKAITPVVVEAVRPYRKGFLVGFRDVETRNDAEILAGRYLFRPMAEVAEAGEDEAFYHQLLGMRVEREDGELVGEVREVYETLPAHLLEVRTEKKVIHLPMVGSVVKVLDVEGRRIVVDPPEGLLDL